MNKETLEEAALRLYPRLINDPYNPKEDDNEEYRDIWISGAKWQKERSYSEEDLISFAHFYFQEEFNSNMQTSKSTKDIFTEWFEQFKNK